MWDWYFDLSKRLRRAREGAAEPIPPTEFEAWVRLTRTVVHAHEYAILGAMDAAYCDEYNAEIAAYHNRLMEKKPEPPPTKGRRK